MVQHLQLFSRWYKNMKDTTKATIVRITLAICIMFSISLMYYVNIVKKEYQVITSPNGPEGRPQ